MARKTSQPRIELRPSRRGVRADPRRETARRDRRQQPRRVRRAAVTPTRRQDVNAAVDAVQVARNVDAGNRAGAAAILDDYIPDCDVCALAAAELLRHMAMFVVELVHDQDRTVWDGWLAARMANLVAGPHDDAHRLVIAAHRGDWDQFWDRVRDYAGDHTPLSELIYELARLGDSALRTAPSCYEKWPAGFYQQSYQLALDGADFGG